MSAVNLRCSVRTKVIFVARIPRRGDESRLVEQRHITTTYISVVEIALLTPTIDTRSY